MASCTAIAIPATTCLGIPSSLVVQKCGRLSKGSLFSNKITNYNTTTYTNDNTRTTYNRLFTILELLTLIVIL